MHINKYYHHQCLRISSHPGLTDNHRTVLLLFSGFNIVRGIVCMWWVIHAVEKRWHAGG